MRKIKSVFHCWYMLRGICYYWILVDIVFYWRHLSNWLEVRVSVCLIFIIIIINCLYFAINFILHTYIHTYIHTNIHTYIYTYIHIYIHTYKYTYKHNDVMVIHLNWPGLDWCVLYPYLSSAYGKKLLPPLSYQSSI